MSLASPGPIQGQLPFGGGGAGVISAAGGGALGDQYAQAYSSALAQNQANYQNILQGYQQTLGAQSTAQQAIGSGYQQLGQSIQNTIQGVGASQTQAIQDAYKQQSGQMTQQMLNSGLGNTTVLGTMQRGPMLDAQKAQVALQNQLAQLSAGYQSQIGQGQLNYQNEANMQNTALANQQLQWMNSIQSLYPNAQAYGQLMGQQGMFNQMSADRAQAAQQYAQQQQAQQLALGRGLRTGAGQGFQNSSGIGTFNPGLPGGLTGAVGMPNIGNPAMFAGIGQGVAPVYGQQAGMGGGQQAPGQSLSQDQQIQNAIAAGQVQQFGGGFGGGAAGMYGGDFGGGGSWD
jgi:hypothetical protein